MLRRSFLRQNNRTRHSRFELSNVKLCIRTSNFELLSGRVELLVENGEEVQILPWLEEVPGQDRSPPAPSNKDLPGRLKIFAL